MIKTYLTAEEVQAMIDSAQCLRDKVILSFYADTGCRASELLKLCVKHLDLKSAMVLIPHLKRGVRKKCPKCLRTAGRNTKFCSKCGYDLAYVTPNGIEERNRLINIGPSTVQLLEEYTKEMKDDEPLIGLSRQRVYYIIRELSNSIGLSGRTMLNPETGRSHFVHPHNFRDSLAVDWLTLAGSDVGKQKALQDQLGHKSFETTMRYHKLTPTAVKAVSEEVRKKRFER